MNLQQHSLGKPDMILSDLKKPVILTVIANWLMGDRVLALASLHAYQTAFVSPGRGTVRKAFLRQAGLSDLRKEIVTIVTEEDQAYRILEDLKTEMHLEDEHSGIAFVRRGLEPVELSTAMTPDKEVHEMEQDKLRAIYVVVNKGFAEDVILAGERAGTRGATVIPAHGEAKEEHIKGLKVSADKELILIITSPEKASRFMDIIHQDPAIIEQGQGQAFVMEVVDSVGIKFY